MAPTRRGPLVVGIALVATAAVWGLRRAPERDWSFRVDVDEPTPVVDLPDRPQAPLWIAPPFAEKLLLVGLIAAIYTSVLNIDTPVLRIIAGTSLIIGASVGVSTLLARRGIAWTSLGIQFVVLAAINSALIALYAELLGNTLNRGLVLFFGLLLTMIIVLYDRYLGERATNPSFS